MKIISYMLLAFVFVFIVMLCSEMMTDKIAVADTVDLDEVMRVKANEDLLTSISIIVFAFALQQMVLPAYTELEKRSTERFSQASTISTTIYFVAILATSVFSVLIFGSTVKS